MSSFHRRSFLASAVATGLIPVFQGAAKGAEDREDPARTNERIAADRQAALEILKPSPKHLQHGLELHANSVVLDTYGFGPGAAVDNAALAKLINSGASNQEITDAREDMMMTRFITDEAERKEYEQAWAAAGVTAIIRNSGEEGSDPLRLLKRLARWISVTDHLRDRFPKALKASDVVEAHKQGRHAIMLTTNGVPLAQNWADTTDELRYVRVFAELGVRMMHLTYNRRNPIGDGCGEPNDAGLSDFGREALAELNRQGVIADCAHSGQRTSLDAARRSSKPMVASHTVVAKINPHVRAKNDEVIRAIADTGGLVGICCIPGFLGRGNDIASFLDHIDEVVTRFGTDYVGIGTDTGYSSRLKPNDAKLPARGPQRVRWESLWPPGSSSISTSAKATASLAWTNWPLFTVGLVQRGYKDQDIQKILAGNMLRVLKANEV